MVALARVTYGCPSSFSPKREVEKRDSAFWSVVNRTRRLQHRGASQSGRIAIFTVAGNDTGDVGGEVIGR
jgi:hypothetical protein